MNNMNKENFNTSITYNENCHYRTSTTDANITLLSNVVNISFTYNEQSYYSDPIEITVLIQDSMSNPIPYGNVIFYYIDDDDITQQQKMIHDAINVDKYGSVTIKYIPHSSGKIIAEYNGAPYYRTTIKESYIELLPKPTYVEFNNNAPYLVNPNEPIEMSVTVTDNEQPIDYGLVTFLNYHAYGLNNPEAGKEKVIGNPSYLNNNGKAKINYSPIQGNTNQKLGNIELIRAVYNYDNNLYGTKWNYYAQSDDYTAIAVREENNVNMLVPKIHKKDTITNARVNDSGLFIVNENNNIYLQCEITINENTIIKEANVEFVITNNNTEQHIQGEFVEDTQYFQASVSNLNEGLYKIYVLIDNPTIEHNGDIISIPVIENQETLTPFSNKDKKLIQDGTYLQQSKSEEYYIQIEPHTNDIFIDLNIENPIITNQILNKNDIIGIINIDDECGKNQLNGTNCFFTIPKLQETYPGTITKQNDILIAKPNEDIHINNIGNYQIDMYVPEQTFLCNETKHKIYDTYSNSIIIKNRSIPSIDLSLNTNNNYYPSDIKYNLKINNIFLGDIINVDIFIDNQLISNHTLSFYNNKITNTIPTQNVGEHTIKAKITTLGYDNIISEEINFTVEKTSLNIYLNKYFLDVHTGDQIDLVFDIFNTQINKIENLDPNKFTVILKEDENIQENIPITIEQNNNQYSVKVTGVIYRSGEWKIKLNYDGDDNYESTNNNFTSFTASNKEPYCININKNDNNIENKIVYTIFSYSIEEHNDTNIIVEEKEYLSITQNILVTCKLFANDQNDTLTFVCITNKNGEFTITRPSGHSNIDWVQRNNIEYTIDPYNEILEIFKIANDQNEAINNFKNTITNYQGSDTLIAELYQQSKKHNFTNLFLGYDEYQNILTL